MLCFREFEHWKFQNFLVTKVIPVDTVMSACTHICVHNPRHAYIHKHANHCLCFPFHILFHHPPPQKGPPSTGIDAKTSVGSSYYLTARNSWLTAARSSIYWKENYVTCWDYQWKGGRPEGVQKVSFLITATLSVCSI